jgi:hypothetical protein
VVGMEGLAVLPAGAARMRRGQWVDVVLLRPPPV